eukprot:UN23953
MNSAKCMVCGHSMVEHFHTIGKGWRKRINKKYKELTELKPILLPKMMLCQEKMDEYKVRVYETRKLFELEKTNLLQHIQEYESNILCKNFVKNVYYNVYDLILYHSNQSHSRDRSSISTGFLNDNNIYLNNLVKNIEWLEKTLEACDYKDYLRLKEGKS